MELRLSCTNQSICTKTGLLEFWEQISVELDRKTTISFRKYHLEI